MNAIPILFIVLTTCASLAAQVGPVACQVTLHSGGIVLGTRVGETEAELKLAAPGGAVTTVEKSDVARTEALPGSLMPPGLLAGLSEEEIRDLMTFLLAEPAAKN